MAKTLDPCIAEIGRPGSYHGCNKPAHYWFRSKTTGHILSYCKRHKHHAGNPTYTGPVVVVNRNGSAIS